MRFRKRNIAVIGAMVAVTIVGCSVATDETGSGSGRPDIRADRETLPAPEEEAAEDTTFDDGRKDMTIKSCKVGDPYDLGDRIIVVDVSFTNDSSKVSDYWAEIEALKPNGDRIEVVSAIVTNVSPGQTVDTGDGDGDEDGVGVNDRVTGLDKCRVLSVDRTAHVR